VAIADQLKQVGLKVNLKQLSTEKLNDPDNECDLVFAEIVMCEPAVDAIRLLGPGGLLPETNPYVNLALRRLEAAKDWKAASDALRDLHRIVYDDTTVIPLWQITEHFAYRKWLKGPSPQSVQLYSDVERWELGVRLVEE
jgi:ABC-type transport system substrate-binding protein